MLFLDEIADLGADESESSRFQLIAGTNRNLDVAVREGAFHEHLFARIDLWTFRLPSLAERREDIELNMSTSFAASPETPGAS